MQTLANDRLIRALLRQPVDRTPIWIMRQAGRYLPEYRATRAKAGSFMQLCKTPELACEVTLQPLARFSLDAAILFSDILTIPDAMGLGLYFTEGEGPAFASPIRQKADVDRLPIPDPETELRYVIDAVRLIKQALGQKLPLIGFAGSPWTLATYMVEGGSSKQFNLVKTMLYREPQLLHSLLAKLAQAVTAYLNAQIAAGADAIMIFDTWGGLLTTPTYEEFSLAYMRRIVASLVRQVDGRTIPVILFTKGGQQWLEAIATSGCDAIGVDWTIELGEARKRVGDKVALQGNLDPAVLASTPEIIQRQVAAVLASYGPGPGHVFNLGHGITPGMPPDNVHALVEAVHKLSATGLVR
jgi:uroporphyrinogen decarboxylase